MLRELQLDGSLRDKAAIAIERLKFFSDIANERFGGFTVCVSGGKDSSVITDLAIRSGVNCSFQTNWTGVDWPETCFFIKEEKRRLEALGYKFNVVVPRDKGGRQITMWSLIRKKGLPSRTRRFCCQYLKEGGDQDNCYLVFGVRWAESEKRKATRAMNEFIERRKEKRFITNDTNLMRRRMNEVCMKKNRYVLNPIIEWTDDEVWEYIRENNLSYNPLYDGGFKRVGCIGCPMSVNRRSDLERAPRYMALYKKAAAYYLAGHSGKYKTIEELFGWWLSR